MPYKEGQQTLMGFLGIPVVTRVAKTRLFGGPYIRMYDLFEVLSYLYMTGAILGRARRDKLAELAKMIAYPGGENEALNHVQKMARERLDRFRNEVGKKPDRFDVFILFRELDIELESVVGLSLNDALEAYAAGRKELMNKVLKASDKKVPLTEAEAYIKVFGMEGIGFGGSFPELTEKMYRNAYENIDMDVWAEARAHGLAIPEKPTMLSFEEQEELILQMVAGYTSEYYPELVDPLDLRRYLNVTQTSLT